MQQVDLCSLDGHIVLYSDHEHNEGDDYSKTIKGEKQGDVKYILKNPFFVHFLVTQVPPGAKMAGK